MMTNKQYALAVRSALAAVPGELRRHREGKVVNYIYATDDGDLKCVIQDPMSTCLLVSMFEWQSKATSCPVCL